MSILKSILNDVTDKIYNRLFEKARFRYDIHHCLLEEHEKQLEKLNKKVFDIVHWDVNELFKRIFSIEENIDYVDLIAKADEILEKIKKYDDEVDIYRIHNKTLENKVDALEQIIKIQNSMKKKQFK